MPNDDQQLIAAVARGDREAFAALVARHRAAVWRLARALTPSDQSAEDVLQETFLAVYRGAAGYRGQAAARAWILGIVRHQAARTFRRRSGEPAESLPLNELGEAAGWGAPGDPEAAAAALEERGRLRDALASLQPEDQEVLVLRDLEQLTAAEAAAVMALSEAAVKSRLHRARLRLLAALRASEAGAAGCADRGGEHV